MRVTITIDIPGIPNEAPVQQALLADLIAICGAVQKKVMRVGDSLNLYRDDTAFATINLEKDS